MYSNTDVHFIRLDFVPEFRIVDHREYLLASRRGAWGSQAGLGIIMCCCEVQIGMERYCMAFRKGVDVVEGEDFVRFEKLEGGDLPLMLLH